MVEVTMDAITDWKWVGTQDQFFRLFVNAALPGQDQPQLGELTIPAALSVKRNSVEEHKKTERAKVFPFLSPSLSKS